MSETTASRAALDVLAERVAFPRGGMTVAGLRRERPALTIELQARTNETADFCGVGSGNEGEWSVYGPSTPLPPADGECHGARSEATGTSRRGLIAAALAAPFIIRPSPASAIARRGLMAADGIRLLVAGQSLAARWLTTPAWDAFQTRLIETGETRPISMLNVGVGGSAALYAYRPVTDPQRYWWDERTASPGPCLVAAVNAIGALPDKPNVVLWAQGQQDGRCYKGEDATAFYRAFQLATLNIITRLRVACNPQSPASVPVIIERLGTTAAGWDAYPGFRLARLVEDRVVGRRDFNAHWGARPTAGDPLADEIHPTDEAFAWRGAETADAVRGRV